MNYVDVQSTIVDDMSTSCLADALLGRTRAQVLAALLQAEETGLHVREVARRTGLDPTGVQRELRKLATLGVVKSRKIGRQKQYSLDSDCPIYPELAGFLRKTAGLADIIRRALEPWRSQIVVAYVYGSQAAGNVGSHSDVDLMIVGDATAREISAVLDDCQVSLAREVNATIFNIEEYKDKLSLKRGFVHQVHNKPKIVLMGNIDELG